MDRNFVIALDFDGTIKMPDEYKTPLEECYLSYGFAAFAEWCSKQKISLILWTCRNLKNTDESNFVLSFLEKYELKNVFVPWFSKEHEDTLVCTNYLGEYTSVFTTGANKLVADAYIDNRNISCPKISTMDNQINWGKVQQEIKILMSN